MNYEKDISLHTSSKKLSDRYVNIFDKIGLLLPGYSGYAERNNRRQNDKLLREKIVTTLNSCEKLMSKRILASIQANENIQINKNEECRKKLNTISAQVKYAPYGESAFFSSNQLKEDELLIIYQKDLALLDRVTEINRYIPELDVESILKKIDGIEAIVNERNEYIKEFK